MPSRSDQDKDKDKDERQRSEASHRGQEASRQEASRQGSHEAARAERHQAERDRPERHEPERAPRPTTERAAATGGETHEDAHAADPTDDPRASDAATAAIDRSPDREIAEEAMRANQPQYRGPGADTRPNTEPDPDPDADADEDEAEPSQPPPPIVDTIGDPGAPVRGAVIEGPDGQPITYQTVDAATPPERIARADSPEVVARHPANLQRHVDRIEGEGPLPRDPVQAEVVRTQRMNRAIADSSDEIAGRQ